MPARLQSHATHAVLVNSVRSSDQHEPYGSLVEQDCTFNGAYTDVVMDGL